MKKTTYQRVIQFFLQKQTIKKYEKLINKKVQFADILGGKQGWSDFFNEKDWGECVHVFPNKDVAKHIFQNLFTLKIPLLEKEYSIKIISKSIPDSVKNIEGAYLLNTKDNIEKEIVKKLNKKYDYLKHGYSKKGILIVGICDPSFCGFEDNRELTKENLFNIRKKTQSLFNNSSFYEILLVDALNNFYLDSGNLTYWLFK